MLMVRGHIMAHEVCKVVAYVFMVHGHMVGTWNVQSGKVHVDGAWSHYG